MYVMCFKWGLKYIHLTFDIMIRASSTNKITPPPSPGRVGIWPYPWGDELAL